MGGAGIEIGEPVPRDREKDGTFLGYNELGVWMDRLAATIPEGCMEEASGEDGWDSSEEDASRSSLSKRDTGGLTIPEGVESRRSYSVIALQKDEGLHL